MTIPTAADIRAWSQLAFEGLDDLALERMIARAVAYIEQVTGRIPLTALPASLVPIAEEAIQRRVEQLAVTAGEGQIAGATSDDGIISFSVPGYSETRATPSETASWKAGVTNRWRALWDLLWLLMTPEKREEWIADQEGVDAPAFAVTEVAWGPGWDVPPPDPGWPGWGVL